MIKKIHILLALFCLLGLIPTSYAYTHWQVRYNISLVSDMQKTLLGNRNGSLDNIKHFFTPTFYINNRKLNYHQMSQHMQHFYKHFKSYSIKHRFITANKNNVAWFVNVKKVTAKGKILIQKGLQLAILKNGKIYRLYEIYQ